MKILHTVETYTPAICGMQKIVKQVSQRLVQNGHEVTVATSHHPERKKFTIGGVQIEQFRIRGNAVRGIEGLEKAKVNGWLFLIAMIRGRWINWKRN